MAMEREQAHLLLDQLDPAQFETVSRLLEQMTGHSARTLADIPPEDEEISEEEEQAVAGAREWLKNNRPIPHKEVLAEFGLTMEDFERMGRTPLPDSGVRH